MKSFVHFVCAALLCILLIPGTGHSQDKLIGARFPALSPDGTQVAFSYMGDVWTVPSGGGRALRLTNNAAYEREPVWSPDGKTIAFTSDRTGNNDIFIIPAKGGEAKQITWHSGNDVATDFSPNGKWIYFTSGRFSNSSVYRISVSGGNALEVLDTYWSWPYNAKVSPDNNGFVFASGMENRFLWRKGYKGSNSSKIWLKEFGSKSAKKLFEDESNAFLPQWTEDGRIYFLSDMKTGCKNIWQVAKDGSGLKQVTSFSENDIIWFSVARKNSAAVFERDFGIWMLDLSTGNSEKVSIDSPSETKENGTFFVKNGRVSEYRLSPDEKKIAAVVRGEIFVLGTDGGYARNVTNSSWRERDIAWDKDSKNIIYISDKNANPDIYSVSALGDSGPVRLTKTPEDELGPDVSPDGKWLAYYRGKRQIRLMQPDGENDKLLVEDDFGGRFADGFSWAPDSKHIAYVKSRTGNSDIYAINIESGEKILLTNTAYDENSPVWSKDGKFILFRSNRSGHSFPEFTGKWDIYQLHLVPEEEEFDEDTFEKLFEKNEKGKDTKGKKKDDKTVEIIFKLENIDRQTKTVVSTLGNDRSFVLSPKDNNTVYFVTSIDGKSHLWKTGLKDKERGKFSSFMAGISSPSSMQFDKSGKTLYYLSRGRIGKITVASKRNKGISFSTKIEVDKTADFEQMLAEIYYTLQYYYYDPGHHNVDWKAMYEHFKPVLKQVREDNDFYDYANEMIGFLNSSHTGARGPYSSRTEKNSVHFGVLWDFAGREITVKRIMKDGPVYAHRDSVAVGDALVSVNGIRMSPEENIHKQLNGLTGKRVILTFTSKRLKRNVTFAVKPVSYGSQRGLIYKEWVQSRKDMVKKRTGDEVAYIHMNAMGWGDLTRFLKELERDAVPRKGLILDLRYNMGGNVHDRVIQALTTPVYSKWKIRGLPETKQSSFGFADKPMVILINEVTLSDGEMTSNGLKALKRGAFVGNTTYGWLIFTTSSRLMNGGSFRLPFWGCLTLDGQDLETIGGVTPDIKVISDINNELAGEDIQLDRAIQEILKTVQ